MTSDAEAGRFEFLLCDAVDRLGRKLADVADLVGRLTFLRINVDATSIGQLTPVHVGVKGTMAQMTAAPRSAAFRVLFDMREARKVTR